MSGGSSRCCRKFQPLQPLRETQELLRLGVGKIFLILAQRVDAKKTLRVRKPAAEVAPIAVTGSAAESASSAVEPTPAGSPAAPPTDTPSAVQGPALSPAATLPAAGPTTLGPTAAPPPTVLPPALPAARPLTQANPPDGPNELDLFALEAKISLTNIRITVASKSEESMLDVPANVTAYSDQDIKKLGYYTLADLANITPGYSTYTIYGEKVSPISGTRGRSPTASSSTRT